MFIVGMKRQSAPSNYRGWRLNAISFAINAHWKVTTIKLRQIWHCTSCNMHSTVRAPRNINIWHWRKHSDVHA